MKKIVPYLIIAGLLVGLFFSMRGCVRRELHDRVILQAAESGPDTGRLWVDNLGREHRRARAAEGDAKTMRIAYGALLDSVARLNKVKQKQIEQITWLSSELRGARTVAVINQHNDDGGTGIQFHYADSWLELHGAGSIAGDSLSELRLNYLLRDSLLITRIRKRNWLFGRRSTLVDVTSANPDVRISGTRSILIRERPKPWGIGVQAGMRYTISSGWKPYAGLGLSYNLIRF